MAEDKTLLEKLNEAWESMPPGAKNKLYNDFDWKHQNVADILKKGRKDEDILTRLLSNIKTVSEDIANDVNEQNEIVQSI